MARRLFDNGLTREEARQQLRDKYHDPNDDKKKTIVAKIKKYIMKFWKDDRKLNEQNLLNDSHNRQIINIDG